MKDKIEMKNKKQNKLYSITNLKGTTMKNLTVIIALVALCALSFQMASAQNFANQSVILAVGSIQKMSVSGNPAPLTISNGTAGTDALAAVSDNSTTYSETHNGAAPLKITAGIDVALGTGYKLEIALASGKGTSAGTVDISGATTAVDVVTGVARGADNNRAITYTFSADASAGELPSTTKTITLTITN